MEAATPQLGSSEWHVHGEHSRPPKAGPGTERKQALPRLHGHTRVNWQGVTGRTALRKCYSPLGM